jgi:hypothetical protein
MKRSRLFISLLLILVSANSISQVADDRRTDPLQQIQKAFPDTVELKNHGKLLEVCPDGTCDGFVTSGSVTVPTLKDFAYLYVFFFSDNVTFDDWRRTEDAKKTAELVLAQNQYRSCANANSLESARCVLRDLSRSGSIRLIFVRYDEGERHALREDLQEKLAIPLAQKCEALTFPPRHDDSQPIPPQLMIPDAPKTVREVSCFLSFKQNSTMIDVVRKCGLPDKHMGSGVYIFVYYMNDCSTVSVGTSDLRELGISHVKQGTSTVLLSSHK